MYPGLYMDADFHHCDSTPNDDIQDYRDGRGLSLEPYEDWVPGPFVRDIDGLIGALSDLVQGRDPMARERGLARLRFHEHRDDRSAARLLDGLGIHSRAEG